MSIILAILLSCGVAAVALLVWASASIRSPFYLRSLCRAKGCGKSCAITFDDGPDLTETPLVLDILARHNVKATFFLIGSKAEATPDLVRRIVTEGHTLGNHTYTHSGLFPLQCGRVVGEELMRTTHAIEQITGLRPRLFRPPFGVTNPIIGCSVRRAGLRSIGWSIRSMDTIDSTPRERVLNHILGQMHDGAVILLHDRCRGGGALLDALLCELTRRGYAVKGVDELFNLQAYEN